MTTVTTIPVVPTLTRKDGSALALTELSGVAGYLGVKGAPPEAFLLIGTLAPADNVLFHLTDQSPGDYDFFAVEIDNQVPPLSSDASATKSFNVPAPVVALAAPSAPTVGDVTTA